MGENIPAIIMDAAQTRGDHPAIAGPKGQLSYAEVAQKMRNVAAALVALGLRKGESVGLWLPNSGEWVVLAMGVQAAGGVLVPLNTRYKATEIRHALGKTRARFLFYAYEFLGIKYDDILAEAALPELEHPIGIDLTNANSASVDAFVTQTAPDAAAFTGAEARLAALSADDVSDIIFTSGTTGLPKGVVTTHGQNVETYRQWNKATTLGPDDRFLLIWPMSHCSGYKAGWLAAALAGATLHPEASLDITRLIERSRNEKITFLPGPPVLFQSMLAEQRAGRADFSSLRVVGTGGTAIDPKMIADVRAELGAEIVYAGYGLTECSGTAAMIFSDDPHDMVITSSGRAIEGTELETMGPDGRILPRGEEGQIVTRGFHVMLCYLDDEVATAEAIDGDGWLRTGDLGQVDEHGFVSITGRAKEMYIVGGFNCYPAEIEHLLSAHPGIREVAVTGVPDAVMGEVGKAYIVWNESAGATDAQQLIGWARTQMANYKAPRFIEFVDALPRNAMGKVEKYRLTND
jgi:HIP---CoA ligase